MEPIDSNSPNNCHTLGLDLMTELGKSQTSLLSGISDETNSSSTEVSDRLHLAAMGEAKSNHLIFTWIRKATRMNI